jgi:aspartyl-tRNA(Asn)/glutamyl-tRNA(Gln) amidotransferase subunit A
MTPLWQFSACELAAAYRDRRSTPSEALQAVLARIDEVNPRINAIVTLDRSGAQAAAQASDRRMAAGKPLSLLDGVPVTIKDSILVGGMRATWGSRLYADYSPEDDEEPVGRLRAAGAIILGKTNVPEFTLHGTTDNALFGTTRNPWDLSLTPGGSSGGAVAAVASGCGAVALGTDGGGSIRRPAAHTGLVGFKPSRGAIPRANGFPAILHDFEVAGPIARTVGDIVIAMEILAGHTLDAIQIKRQQSSVRILYIPTFSDAPVDPAISNAVAQVASALERKGHQVERADDFKLAAPIAEVWPVISQTGLAWLLAKHPDKEAMIAPALADMARQGRTYTAADYLNALDIIKTVDRDFARLFERVDILLTPATAAMPWPAAKTHPETIAGQPVGPRGHAVFTPFANALGLPAISLPCPIGGQALPVGFQLCMAKGRDLALLDFARAYEQAVGWPARWPSVPIESAAGRDLGSVNVQKT